MTVLSFVQHIEEIGFANDADVLAKGDKFIGPSVLGAFGVSGECGNVLIADDQQGCFFGYACLDGDASVRGDSRSFGSRHGKLACKAGGVAVQWAVWVPIGFDAGREALFFVAPVGFGQDAAVGHSGLLFSQQNDLGSGAGVLFRVVVLEVQPEVDFQVCQAVAAVIFEFRPSAAGDQYAVCPVGLDIWNGVGLTRRIQGAFVKFAVLDKLLAFKAFLERFVRLVKCWRICDGLFANAVNAHKGRVEVVAWINQGAGGHYLAVVCDACEANLANGGFVRVGCFNVNRNEAKLPIGKLFVESDLWRSCGRNFLFEFGFSNQPKLFHLFSAFLHSFAPIGRRKRVKEFFHKLSKIPFQSMRDLGLAIFALSSLTDCPRVIGAAQETRASGFLAVTSESQFGGRWFARVAPCSTSLLDIGRRSILPDCRPFFLAGCSYA